MNIIFYPKKNDINEVWLSWQNDKLVAESVNYLSWVITNKSPQTNTQCMYSFLNMRTSAPEAGISGMEKLLHPTE